MSSSDDIDMCWYCLSEMVAIYRGVNQEHFQERLQKVQKIETECNCTVTRRTAAGYCECRCTCPGVTKIITYNRKLEAQRVDYEL